LFRVCFSRCRRDAKTPKTLPAVDRPFPRRNNYNRQPTVALPPALPPLRDNGGAPAVDDDGTYLQPTVTQDRVYLSVLYNSPDGDSGKQDQQYDDATLAKHTRTVPSSGYDYDDVAEAKRKTGYEYDDVA